MTRAPKERCKDVVGKLCRLTREVHTKGGDTHLIGSRWRVYITHRGMFALEGVDEKGVRQARANGTIQRIIRKIPRNYFEVETGVAQ